MTETYKHSYKSGEILMTSLFCIYTGYQRCEAGISGARSQGSLLYPSYFVGNRKLYSWRKDVEIRSRRYVYLISGRGSKVLCDQQEPWEYAGWIYGGRMRHRSFEIQVSERTSFFKKRKCCRMNRSGMDWNRFYNAKGNGMKKRLP